MYRYKEAYLAIRERSILAREALKKASLPIGVAPEDYRTLVLFDGNKFAVGQRWKHWSFPERKTVWWTNQYGVFFPTRFVFPHEKIKYQISLD